MAARFWVGGTGTWDATNNGHWSLTTGGTGNQAAPTAADTVTFDGLSGGGIVTVNTTVTVQSITCGAFTGTLDFSVNNNDVTLTAATGFSGTGTGLRTINLGNGVWTISSTSTPWQMTTTTSLTFNANGSTISLTGTTPNTRNFLGGGLTYNAVTIASNTAGGAVQASGNNTFGSLTLTGPNAIMLPNVGIQTITTLSLNGTSGSEVYVVSSGLGTLTTISVASNAPTMTWAAFRDIAATGGATFVATNSFDLGHNTGIAITAPATGGGGRMVQINNDSLVA